MRGKNEMARVFEFLFLTKTKQMVNLKRTDKDGRCLTIRGKSYEVLNTCMDIGISQEEIAQVQAQNNEILVFVKNEGKESEMAT